MRLFVSDPYLLSGGVGEGGRGGAYANADPMMEAATRRMEADRCMMFVLTLVFIRYCGG